jgi:hypothetical protein
MDLKKLLEPYAEGGLRTIEGQIKWLQGKGIPQAHIDKAILSVYDEMDRGKAFANGNDLDQELLRVAREEHQAELSDQAAKLEAFFNGLKGKWREEMAKAGRPSVWKRIRAVFRP